MEDERIIALYWARDQRALEETEQKYGIFVTSSQVLELERDVPLAKT